MLHTSPITFFCILSLVTTTSAPRVASLIAYPNLFRAYLVICPNSKLPVKFHAISIEAEHKEHGPLFAGGRVSDQACMVAGCIRNTLVKYRDVACNEKKRMIVKKMVLLPKLHPAYLNYIKSTRPLKFHMYVQYTHMKFYRHDYKLIWYLMCVFRFYTCKYTTEFCRPLHLSSSPSWTYAT